MLCGCSRDEVKLMDRSLVMCGVRYERSFDPDGDGCRLEVRVGTDTKKGV